MTAENCPSCGKHLSLGAVFCVQCGLDLRTGCMMTMEVAAETPEPSAPSKPKQRSWCEGHERAIGILAGGLLLIILAAGLKVWLKYQTKSPYDHWVDLWEIHLTDEEKEKIRRDEIAMNNFTATIARRNEESRNEVITVETTKQSLVRTPPNPVGVMMQRMLEGRTLTGKQKAKLQEVAELFNPRMNYIMQKLDVMTPEQKKARQNVILTAQAAGKKDNEIQAAIDAAVQLSDEQQARQAAAKKEMTNLVKELRDKVMVVLTPEQ